MPKLWPAVHWVVLIGPVQEQGLAYAVPQHCKGPARALYLRRGLACNQPECFTPTRLITDIFVLMGDIGSRGRGKGFREASEGASYPLGVGGE